MGIPLGLPNATGPPRSSTTPEVAIIKAKPTRFEKYQPDLVFIDHFTVESRPCRHFAVLLDVKCDRSCLYEPSERVASQSTANHLETRS